MEKPTKIKKGVAFQFVRRDFLKLLSFTGLSTLLPGRVSAKNDWRNDKNIPKQYIQNRDLPGFHIRSANPFMGVDMGAWGLAVGGMVKNPVGLSYEDLFGMKMFTQVSRLKCVECWSAKAEWQGFQFSELVEKVQPDPSAKFVYIQSADSYYESFAIEELLTERPAEIGVFVMHNKLKTKKAEFPDCVNHVFVGKNIEDVWVDYPWDARDIVQHERDAAQGGVLEVDEDEAKAAYRN